MVLEHSHKRENVDSKEKPSSLGDLNGIAVRKILSLLLALDGSQVYPSLDSTQIAENQLQPPLESDWYKSMQHQKSLVQCQGLTIVCRKRHFAILTLNGGQVAFGLLIKSAGVCVGGYFEKLFIELVFGRID